MWAFAVLNLVGHVAVVLLLAADPYSNFTEKSVGLGFAVLSFAAFMYPIAMFFWSHKARRRLRMQRQGAQEACGEETQETEDASPHISSTELTNRTKGKTQKGEDPDEEAETDTAEDLENIVLGTIA